MTSNIGCLGHNLGFTPNNNTRELKNNLDIPLINRITDIIYFK